MKLLLSAFVVFFLLLSAKATIHVVKVWDGYFSFLNPTFNDPLIVQLGDTIQWLPLDQPAMVHTVTSSNLPNGASSFDYIWQAPADTFFQYIPTVVGTYDYVCTPHEVSHGMVGSFQVQDTTVGLSNTTSQEQLLTIYPNPVSDFLIVQSSFINAPFNIVNTEGVIVLKGKVNSQIDVSELPNGIYVFHLLVDKPRYAKFTKE